jgi:hypothetical protein
MDTKEDRGRMSLGLCERASVLCVLWCHILKTRNTTVHIRIIHGPGREKGIAPLHANWRGEGRVCKNVAQRRDTHTIHIQLWIERCKQEEVSQ